MNMQKIMQQAQQMQAKAQQVQGELELKEVEATAGGGVIKVVATGGKKIKSIKISPEAVDEDDVQMLEDLVLTAVNDALNKADELSNAEMAKVTGGMGNLF